MIFCFFHPCRIKTLRRKGTHQSVPFPKIGTSTLDIQYAYPSAGNNGKLASQNDVISGEQITYTYDALNRLATAVTSDNPNVTQWGQSYNYDGFGNLTDQNVIKGSAPSMHVVYSASTNRQTGDAADANGNLGSGYLYDIENRLLKPGASATQQYGYDSGNKRVWRGDTGVDEFAFFAGNQKLGAYAISVNGSTVSFALSGTNVYFGGRMIAKGVYNAGGTNDKCTLTSIAQDRLGSTNGKFYPYGQERPSATANDKEKFTGYFRDASTGLDYADQRYEQPGVGRFMTPDPYGGSAKAQDPGSWNRYAYVGGDPVNRTDPSGLLPPWWPVWIQWGAGNDDPWGDCGFLYGTFCGVYVGDFQADFSVDVTDVFYKKPPKVKYVSAAYQSAFNDAFSDAENRLGDKNCAKLFGMSEKQLDSILENADYQYSDSPNLNFTGPAGPDTWATTAGNTVTINDLGPFFANSTPNSFGYETASLRRTFTLLHELGHLTGKNTEIDNIFDRNGNEYESDFNKSLMKDCMHQTVPTPKRERPGRI